MELSIPPLVSAILGTGLPFHGSSEIPFTVIPPKQFKSICSLYSLPDPKVPDAVVTGFFNVIPAIETSILLFIPNHLRSPKDRAIFANFQIFPIVCTFSLYFNYTSQTSSQPIGHSFLHGKLRRDTMPSGPF